MPNNAQNIPRSKLDVRNGDGQEEGRSVWVKVSQTRNAGQYGYFEIPWGDTERWSRHVGHTCTISLSDIGPDGPVVQEVQHRMGLSSGDNKYRVHGSRLVQS